MNKEILKGELDYLEEQTSNEYKALQRSIKDTVIEINDLLLSQGHSGCSFEYLKSLLKEYIFGGSLKLIDRDRLNTKLICLEYECEQDDDLEFQRCMTKYVLDVYDIILRDSFIYRDSIIFRYMKELVNKLIFDGGILKPILSYTEAPDDWVVFDSCGKKNYQNKRRSSVFYDPEEDRYTDIDRVTFIDTIGCSFYTNSSQFKGFENIQMPYIPDVKWYIHLKDGENYMVDRIEELRY